jgi:signal transduction histidine kinase
MNPKGKIKIFSEKDGFNSSLIMSIKEHLGKIYVGTNDNGLIIISNDKVEQTFDTSNGTPSTIVFNTYMDANQNVWIAMNGGLGLLKNDTINYIDSRDGLYDDTPFDVIEDDNGYFWLPSTTGITKINRKEILNYLEYKNPKGIETIHYNHNDGMANEECNATTLVLKASDGSLLFPTIDGISQINPNTQQTNTIVPNVIIENLFINNKPANLLKNIVVPAGKNRLTFEFTALSLHEPKRNQFKYQLIGYEDSWIDSYENRKVSYTNLSPGEYMFRVIASNNNNIWNKVGDSVSFTIKPLFTQTTTFYFLVAFGLLLIIYFIYRIRVKQFQDRQKTLENMVKLRTQEISVKNNELEEQKQEILSQSEKLFEQKVELEKTNADKDKMFSIIGHDLRSPMGNFKAMLENLAEAPERYDDERRTRILQILNETAKNTYDLLENLLSWSKAQMGAINFEPEVIDINHIVNDVIKLSNPLAKKKDIEIRNLLDSKTSAFADSNMVRTIFRNLIMNAVKFTNDNGFIEISGQYVGDWVKFSIKDNGIGLMPEAQKNLFENNNLASSLGTHNEKGSGLGLILCKEFVDKNGGEIWVESEPNNGSVFYFTLPLFPQN